MYKNGQLYAACDRCGTYTKVKRIELKGPTIVDTIDLCQACLEELGTMKVEG
jgi:hypothetical protein